MGAIVPATASTYMKPEVVYDTGAYNDTATPLGMVGAPGKKVRRYFFATSGGGSDTWTAPQGTVRVAWEPTATTDQVAVTLNHTTFEVTFTSSAAIMSGHLILWGI